MRKRLPTVWLGLVGAFGAAFSCVIIMLSGAVRGCSAGVLCAASTAMLGVILVFARGMRFNYDVVSLLVFATLGAGVLGHVMMPDISYTSLVPPRVRVGHCCERGEFCMEFPLALGYGLAVVPVAGAAGRVWRAVAAILAFLAALGAFWVSFLTYGGRGLAGEIVWLALPGFGVGLSLGIVLDVAECLRRRHQA